MIELLVFSLDGGITLQPFSIPSHSAIDSMSAVVDDVSAAINIIMIAAAASVIIHSLVILATAILIHSITAAAAWLLTSAGPMEVG